MSYFQIMAALLARYWYVIALFAGLLFVLHLSERKLEKRRR
jgi:hypothetical protein